MEQKEIVEGNNKMISKFMGKPDHIMPELMLYDKSWDWLMPVVEKIGVAHFGDSEQSISATLSMLQTRFHRTREYEGGMWFNSPEAVWIAVVSYINTTLT
jgi:hypothetical protein